MLRLHNTWNSYKDGPVKTLQEQFTDFCQEYKEVLKHHHGQLSEQLKGHEEALRALDNKLQTINEKIDKTREEIHEGFTDQTPCH